MDPHHFDAKPDADMDSTYRPDADPHADTDSDLTLCGSGFLFEADADPYQIYHPDADPDSDPDSSFNIKAHLERVSNRLIFYRYI